MFVLSSYLTSKKIKSNSCYSVYGLPFDGFGDDFAGKAAIFCVDNSSSGDSDNPKNNFLISNEGPMHDIADSVSTAERKFSINFTKYKGKFDLGL